MLTLVTAESNLRAKLDSGKDSSIVLFGNANIVRAHAYMICRRQLMPVPPWCLQRACGMLVTWFCCTCSLSRSCMPSSTFTRLRPMLKASVRPASRRRALLHSDAACPKPVLTRQQCRGRLPHP